MKKNVLSLSMMLLSLFTFTQSTAQSSSFEEITLSKNSYNNGSDFSGGFTSGGAFFTNMFDTTFGPYWEGFAITNMSDDSTKGYSNQYSAITGTKRVDGNNYAIMYDNGKIRLSAAQKTKPIIGFYITNTTYAYYDMKEGSSFSKKFGGATGNDSDYFRVVISAWKNGGNPADTTLSYYLADYRFADNSKDYIVKNWEWVNLEAFGIVDSFAFYFESSDTGSFGINTPQYLCMDLFNGRMVGLQSLSKNEGVKLYPNPATNQVTVATAGDINLVEIYTLSGQLVQTETERTFDVSGLPSGVYIAKVIGKDAASFVRFVKE